MCCCFFISPIDPVIITDLSSDSSEELMGQDTLLATKIPDIDQQVNSYHMVEASTSRPWVTLILPPPYSRSSQHLSTSNIFIMPRLDQSGSFLGPALTVLSANIQSFSTAKQQILTELCSNLHCDVLCLQETHRGSNNNRPSIEMSSIGA